MMGSLMKEYRLNRTAMISASPVGNVEEFVHRMQLAREILERQITNCVLLVELV